MHNSWQSFLPSYKRDNGPQEIEALQTDTMRFIAILGLVLMAIFALVQSLPVGPADAPGPSDPRRRPQPEQARSDQTRKAELFQQQARLDAQQAAKALDQAVHALQQTNQALREREQRLMQLNHQINQRQRSREDLEREIAAQQRRLTALAQELQAARPPSKAKTVPPSPEDQPGFSLRFASDESLAFLVHARQVQIYAMAGKRTWTWEPDSRNARFRPAGRPNTFYEMDPNTVPPPYRMGLRKAVTGIDPRQLTWGVILPEPTQRQIDQLMGQHAGGNLVIQKDGQVSIEP